MKKTRGMEELLLDLVKDIYYAENKLVKALPKMAKKANSEELKIAFENHLEETKEQVTRLEKIFKELGVTAKGKKCYAIDGLLEEAKEVMAENLETKVKDAGMIIAAQKVEHYEMAAYGSIRTIAEILGHDTVAELAQETLDEEGDADKKLNEIAMTINEDAASVKDWVPLNKKISKKKEWAM